MSHLPAPPCTRHTELRLHVAVLRALSGVTRKYSLPSCQAEPSPLLCHTNLSPVFMHHWNPSPPGSHMPPSSVTLSLSSAAYNTEPPHFCVTPSPSSARCHACPFLARESHGAPLYPYVTQDPLLIGHTEPLLHPGHTSTPQLCVVWIPSYHSCHSELLPHICTTLSI